MKPAMNSEANLDMRANPHRMLARSTAILTAASMVMASIASAQSIQTHTSWRSYAGSGDGSSYSALTQVNRSNVSQLAVAWKYDTADQQGYTVSPIVIDRTMYTFAKNGAIVALDAGTGKEIWAHPAPEGGSPTRGVSYWESKDRKDRRIFMTWGNSLHALDAATGKTISSFGTNGAIDLRENLGRDTDSIKRIGSRTPGRVFENLIIMGSSPGEDYLTAPGDVRAYNVITGKLAWTFHTIPRPGEFGYDSWPKDAWKYAGAANAWGDITVDEKNGIVFLPTGSATYDFYGADRPGDNLFANSVLALDARTGKRIWHFQTVHHDLNDYDNVAGPQLLNATIDGKKREIVAFAGKTGFLYVFDRLTGKPIWPIDEKPVPRSVMPGEKDSPTQPFPSKPPAFARQSFTVDDLNPHILTDAERAKWADILSKARNDGLFTPPERDRLTVNMPGHSGGAALFAPSANPTTGEMYVVSFDGPSFLKLETSAEGTLNNNWLGPIVSGIYGCESVCSTEKADDSIAAYGGAPEGDAKSESNVAALQAAGRATFQENCAMCHGDKLQGGGAIPTLLGVTHRLNDQIIRAILQKGQGQMPPFPTLDAKAVDGLISFLHDPGIKPTMYNASDDRPYPEGAALPAGKQRYFSGWGFAPALIKPPWSTLTAYDLNSGTIKWQVPFGEAMGVAPKGNNFGILQFHGAKASVAVTASGLLFSATPDAKFRAWDAETGKVVWQVDLPDRAAGIPAIYQIDGRQYITISVRGSYIAYALPGGKPGEQGRRDLPPGVLTTKTDVAASRLRKRRGAKIT